MLLLFFFSILSLTHHSQYLINTIFAVIVIFNKISFLFYLYLFIYLFFHLFFSWLSLYSNIPSKYISFTYYHLPHYHHRYGCCCYKFCFLFSFVTNIFWFFFLFYFFSLLDLSFISIILIYLCMYLVVTTYLPPTITNIDVLSILLLVLLLF